MLTRRDFRLKIMIITAIIIIAMITKYSLPMWIAIAAFTAKIMIRPGQVFLRPAIEPHSLYEYVRFHSKPTASQINRARLANGARLLTDTVMWGALVWGIVMLLIKFTS